jgi:hypothetical protein
VDSPRIILRRKPTPSGNNRRHAMYVIIMMSVMLCMYEYKNRYVCARCHSHSLCGLTTCHIAFASQILCLCDRYLVIKVVHQLIRFFVPNKIHIKNKLLIIRCASLSQLLPNVNKSTFLGPQKPARATSGPVECY